MPTLGIVGFGEVTLAIVRAARCIPLPSVALN
jgi:hypothetical protein